MRISFDFDGVLSLTPFGRMAVHGPRVHVADLPENYAQYYDTPARRSRLRLLVEYARFAWRKMAPDAAEVLRNLGAAHELYIVTGRSAQGETLLHRWLRRNQLEDKVIEVRMAPRGLRPPQHKLAIAKMLAVDVHIDDDPRTAFYMARNGVPRVYLLDHTHAASGVDLPPGLEVVYSLRDFEQRVQSSASSPADAQ